MKASELRDKLKNINGDYDVMTEDGEYVEKIKGVRVDDLRKRIILKKWK